MGLFVLLFPLPPIEIKTQKESDIQRRKRNENALSSNKFDWKLPLKTSERHLESSDLAKMFN